MFYSISRKIKYFPLLIFPFNLLLGAPRVGVVYDSFNAPIPYVTIFNKSRNIWTISDEYGTFVLSDQYRNGDTLVFSRIGFRDLTLEYKAEDKPFIVKLSHISLTLDSVRVEGRRVGGPKSNLTLKEIVRSPEFGIGDAHQILTSIPGLYLKSYGGRAGVATISLDGSPASHTRIMINGFEMTNAQNGQFDISQIPSYLLDIVSYKPDIIGSGSENSEGLISIEQKEGSTELTLAQGSYGLTEIHFSYGLDKNDKRFSFSGGKVDYLGNYKSVWREQEITRKNNYFHQKYINLKGKFLINRSAFINGWGYYSTQSRGVAGLIWNPTPNASREDNLGLLGIKAGWAGKNGFSYFQLMHRLSNEKYVNPLNAIDNDHFLRTDQIILRTHRKVRQSSLDLISDISYDYLISSKAGKHYRWTLRNDVIAELFLFKNFYVLPWLRYEYSPQLYSCVTEGLKLHYSGGGFLNSFSLTWGSYYNFPSFNDLYWQPGGNPNLKPEVTEKWEVNTKLNVKNHIEIILNGYYKNDRNLIQWMPIQSYWQPTNILKARRIGGKCIFQFFIHKPSIKGYYQIFVNDSRNLTTGDNFGKRLRYTPRNTQSGGLEFRYRNISINTNFEKVSKRIAMYNWPSDIFLPEYLIYNLTCSYMIELWQFRVYLTFAANNLTDQKYETVLGYPEPGRTFTYSVQIMLK